MLLDKDGTGRVRFQGKLGIFKRNQAGLRIPLSSHASWSHFRCLFAGLLSHRRDQVLVSSLNPQRWGAKPHLQPQALHSQRSPGTSAVPNQTQCHKQGLEPMAGCPWPAWRKGQQQDKGMTWIDPALRAKAGSGTAREHSQHCPSFSPAMQSTCCLN